MAKAKANAKSKEETLPVGDRPSPAPPGSASPHPDHGPWRVGTCYFVRTVTMHVVGRLVAVYPGELVLADPAWVADSGRFHAALKTGNLKEVEPFPLAVIVGRGAIVDATEWSHPVPLTLK